MNIWLIQTGEPLPIKNGVRKMRTSILADKLVKCGHSVFWWASAFEHQQKVIISKKDKNFGVSERYMIRVICGCGYHRNISLARYIDHHIVALKFRVQSKKFPKPDIIVASMPDHILAYEAARYARKNGIPFLVDIRDLWPDIFLDRFRSTGLYGLVKRVLALDFARLSFLLKNADAFVAVSRGYLKWGLDKIGRTESPFDKVFYLGYKKSDSENPANADGSLDVPVLLRGRDEQKLFVFIGTFGISYELELIIQAAKYFSRSGRTDICFVMAGAGEKFDLIGKKAFGLKNVVLLGWIVENEINALLKMGYTGFLSYIKDAPQGLPNKPFEYLSAGLPIISSLEGEMAELVNRYQFGLNYMTGDLNGLCRCIERLASDSALHDKMSKNAMEFFKKYGDADKIYDDYARYIEQLVEHKSHDNGKLEC